MARRATRVLGATPLIQGSRHSPKRALPTTSIVSRSRPLAGEQRRLHGLSVPTAASDKICRVLSDDVLEDYDGWLTATPLATRVRASTTAAGSPSSTVPPIFSLAAAREEPTAGTSSLRWRPPEAHPSRGQPVTTAVRASRSARGQSRQGADRSFELAAMDDECDAPPMPFAGGQLVGAHRPVQQTQLAGPQSPPRRRPSNDLASALAGIGSLPSVCISATATRRWSAALSRSRSRSAARLTST